jgi:PKD repeat protein
LGNGVTALNSNPSTTYTTPGVYTVTLRVTNASGSDSIAKVNYITIYASPTVSFMSPDTALSCIPKAVTFVNSSIPNGSGTTTYYWDFGDGSNSGVQTPSHTYTVAGTYSVSLIVTNSAGCASVLNKTNYVHAAPRPNI